MCKNNDVKILNMLLESNTFELYLAELISADSNCSKDLIEEHLDKLNHYIVAMNDSCCNLTNKQKELIENGVKILKRDLEIIC